MGSDYQPQMTNGIIALIVALVLVALTIVAIVGYRRYLQRQAPPEPGIERVMPPAGPPAVPSR